MGGGFSGSAPGMAAYNRPNFTGFSGAGGVNNSALNSYDTSFVMANWLAGADTAGQSASRPNPCSEAASAQGLHALYAPATQKLAAMLPPKSA
eukprot:gene43071-23224_t